MRFKTFKTDSAIIEDYIKHFGRPPGSLRTNRLRKKLRRVVMSWWNFKTECLRQFAKAVHMPHGLHSDSSSSDFQTARRDKRAAISAIDIKNA